MASSWDAMFRVATRASRVFGIRSPGRPINIAVGTSKRTTRGDSDWSGVTTTARGRFSRAAGAAQAASTNTENGKESECLIRV
jgi:hypothetical protein